MMETYLEVFAEARFKARQWLLDAGNWHAISGTCARFFDDEGVGKILEGAVIHREDDAGGSVFVVSGWLSRIHGVDGSGEGYPFLLVREKGDSDKPVARHMLFLPTRPYHPGDEMDVPIGPFLPGDAVSAWLAEGDGG